jgi:hypothetical protein
MPNPITTRKAVELQNNLQALLGHDKVQVRPYGRHLQIQMKIDDDANTVARLTEAGSTTYTAAFRNHSGRWEPLPGHGDIAHMAELVTSLLGMFLHPGNY